MSRLLANPLFYFFIAFFFTLAVGSYDLAEHSRALGIILFAIDVGIFLWLIPFSRRHGWW